MLKRLNELNDLNPEQLSVCERVRTDVLSRWPDLEVRTGPTPKMEVDGEIRPPRPDAYWGVWFVNGPTLEAMRGLLAGRTSVCGRMITIGAVLWASDQAEIRFGFTMAGARMLEKTDLTGPNVADAIARNDDWAAQFGATRDASSAEGYDILFSSERVARLSGSWWPSRPEAGTQ